MDRNDQIVLSIVGGVAAISILLWAILANGTSVSAAQWVQSILTAFAIFAAVAVPLWTESQRRDLQHQVAEIFVASELRTWLRVAPEDISDNQQYCSTGGNDGRETFEIPQFSISKDQIAAMRPDYARQVLSLIERRARRQNNIYSERFYGDDTDALMEYDEQIAHLFWSARRIYTELAMRYGLDTETNRTNEIDAVKYAAQTAKKYRETAAA